MNMKSFEEKVLEGLIYSLSDSKVSLDDCNSIGVAVSGGADSISLLCALNNILPKSITLKAVTVNHNIRAPEETAGDADYVETLCKSLNVPCVRYEIERGLVEKKSVEDKNGIEDSARRLRYDKFRHFMENEKVEFLCLAHNKNDQEETILMRILQGSGDLGGIPVSRGKFIRPLISIYRWEIENYLSEKNISYRIDSTNLENEMLRNRIRNILVPVLDQHFNGWKKAVEHLSEKSRRDNEALDGFLKEALVEIDYEEKESSVTFNGDVYFSFDNAIKDRILMEAVKHAGASERIPQSFLSRWTEKKYAEFKKTEGSSGIQFTLEKGLFTVEKKKQVATEEGFFAIIEKPGTFSAGNCTFEVSGENHKVTIRCNEKEIQISGLEFPFAFRSRQPGDEVKNSDGAMRSLSKILDGWKVSYLKDRIPVIQKVGSPLQDIKCIWGSLYGFSDWIVVE